MQQHADFRSRRSLCSRCVSARIDWLDRFRSLRRVEASIVDMDALARYHRCDLVRSECSELSLHDARGASYVCGPICCAIRNCAATNKCSMSVAVVAWFCFTAARSVPRGKATGIDLWQVQDQSGNSESTTRENAKREGLSDRIELTTGDIRKLPFDDASFDLVVSSLAIHNVPSVEGRDRAIEESLQSAQAGWPHSRRGLQVHGRLRSAPSRERREQSRGAWAPGGAFGMADLMPRLDARQRFVKGVKNLSRKKCWEQNLVASEATISANPSRS